MTKLQAICMAILVIALSVSLVSAATITEKQKLLSSDGVIGDVFGFPISVEGDIAVAGARFSSPGGATFQGVAYVLERVGGQWVDTQKLTASDGAPFQFFGFKTAIRGNTIVVGAFAALNDHGVASGAVYVFENVGGTWVETQKLSNSTDGAGGDGFGLGTAIEGNTLVVGASNHNGSGAQSGIVHVYEKSGGAWVEDARILPGDSAAGDRFGVDIALQEGTLVVGASKVGFQGPSIGAGSAYVFTKSAGSWSEQAKLTAGVDKDHFGISVGIFEDTVVVGAPQLNFTGPATGPGSAYVYKKSGNDWNQQAHLTASDGAFGDKFGTDVSVSGNTIVAGAAQHNSADGAAYVYQRSGNTWAEENQLVASDAIQGTNLGEAVAIAGGDILVGASNIDFSPGDPRVGPGAVYVYDR